MPECRSVYYVHAWWLEITREHWIHWTWSYRRLWADKRMLGTKPQFSAATAPSAPNCWSLWTCYLFLRLDLASESESLLPKLSGAGTTAASPCLVLAGPKLRPLHLTSKHLTYRVVPPPPNLENILKNKVTINIGNLWKLTFSPTPKKFLNGHVFICLRMHLQTLIVQSKLVTPLVLWIV